MNKIATKVLLFGLLLAWLPLILFGGFVTFTIKPRLEASAVARMQYAATLQATAVDQILTEIANTLTTVTKTYRDSLVQAPVQTTTMINILKIHPLLEEIYLYDAKGQIVNWASRRRITNFVQIPPVLNKPCQAACITNLNWEADGRLTATLCVPVYQLGQTDASGYLAAKLGLRSITDHALAGLLSSGQAFIINSDGNLIGHQDFSQVLAKRDVSQSLSVQKFLEESRQHAELNKTEPAAVALPPDARESLHYTSYTGKAVLGIYAPIGQWGWAVIVEQNIDQALAPVRSWGKNLFIVGLLLSLFAFLLSYYISRRITSPLARLEKGVYLASRGEWRQSLPITGSSELRRLTQIFNEMLDGQRQRLELEHRLAQADKFASLGTVASGIAHELNNPLAVIAGYSEDLLDRLATENLTELEPEARRYLQLIHEQTQRCKKITGTLLDTARIPKGSGEIIDAVAGIEAVREMLLYRAKNKGILIKELAFTSSQTSLRIHIDRGEYQQLLLNLYINALDACQAGGEIATTLSVKSGAVCHICIQDTGIGISKDILPRLGEAFYTTKPPGQGTGLGLVIVRQILSRWNGTLQLASEGTNLGTSVIIELPLAKEDLYANACE